ncbi:MAG TPA: hypothetical protein VN030_14400 [Cellvibrio sp.]|nr:hypothetical protein [Cellvibrio sp.]
MKLLQLEQLHSGDKAWLYARDFCRGQQTRYIANVATEFLLLDTGSEILPVSCNGGREKVTGEQKNSYVVSPLTAYIDYALVEIKALNKPWASWPLSALVRLIGMGLRLAKINRLLQINNWLLSTNIYPEKFLQGEREKIDDLKQLFCNRYPDFAFGFRSLNEYSNRETIAALSQAGFIALPSRQVYLFDAAEGSKSAFMQKHNTKIDRKALAHCGLQLVDGKDFSEADFQRCEQLYRWLYIDKYCALNPQYSAQWLKTGQTHQWLTLAGLRNTNGQLEGVVGWFENDRIITAPIVGYNTSLPSSAALYRCLTQLCLHRAAHTKKLLNFSSGAAEFKRLRGGVPAIEYSMMYAEHLSLYQRFCWKSLGLILRTIAVPLMKRWQL